MLQLVLLKATDGHKMKKVHTDRDCVCLERQQLILVHRAELSENTSQKRTSV